MKSLKNLTSLQRVRFRLAVGLFACYFSISSYADEFSFPDPYPEIYKQVEVLPYFCHGWNKYNVIFDSLLAQQKFKTVIEVGVFLGNWTMYIAKSLPPGSRYFAVDHWEGSEEHHVPGTVENECLKNFYQQFLSNIIHTGLTDKVIPVRMNSLEAAKKLQQLNIQADLIYIDAAHDFIAVLQDLYAWFPLLAPGGMFCGDDWHYGGVQQAVKMFAEKKGLKIIINNNFWQLEVPNT
jgi:predicted O-methyltransferase YrrM